MNGERKSFASLGPTLLARKGSARPAMRPQLATLSSIERPMLEPAQDLTDLGWNDMGEGADVPPTPAATFGKPAITRRSALDEGRRAAFTLRVDAERHLKLRLACTIRNISAQQIVTEALDRLLSEVPNLEPLANQLQRK